MYFSSTYKITITPGTVVVKKAFFYDWRKPNLKEKLGFSISACQRENKLSW